MILQFVKLDPRATLPTVTEENSIGYDLYVLPFFDDPIMEIPGRTSILFQTGLIAVPPFGFHLEIVFKNKLFAKSGLTLLDDVGLVGSSDREIKIRLYNPGDISVDLDTSKPAAQLILRENIIADVKEMTLADFARLNAGASDV
jgi:dUTPase